MSTDERTPRPGEPSTVPSVAPSAGGFKIPPDSGGTIPTAHRSSGASIPSGYGPAGKPIIEKAP